MSVKLKGFLNNYASEQYLKAIQLVNTDSKTDPKDRPYQSYYKARDILKKISKDLNEIIGAGSEKNNSKTENNIKELSLQNGDGDKKKETICVDEFERLLSVVHLRLGSNQIETEELSEGGKELERCKMLVKADDVLLGVKQEVFNQLGLLKSQQDDLEGSLEHLEAAKMMYQIHKHLSAPWTPDEFFSEEAYDSQQDSSEKANRRKDTFENNYTHTLYFLAQVYGKLGRTSDSAFFCTETLCRQLDRHTYEPHDWALNAATISQYYTSVRDFRMARHCLAAAETVLKEAGFCPEKLCMVEGEKEEEKRRKKLQGWADLFRCWSKYCINLLEFSRDHAYALLEKKEDEKVDEVVEGLDDSSVNVSFNLVVDSCEGQVTAGKVLLFENARQVFLRGQAWVRKAQDFYQLDGHCTDYTELVLDHSCLFKLLAFWEDDMTRQCRIHKRRCDMLSDLLEQLNPQHYLVLCCQLAFELGEVYSSMLDLKLALLETDQHSSNPAAKINSLAHKSIAAFTRYLGLLNTPQGTSPDPFNDSDERPALLAHFYIARMHSKLITSDTQQQLHNNHNCLKHYTFLVDYCDRHPTGAAKVAEERTACQEMLQLLPQKMQRLRALL